MWRGCFWPRPLFYWALLFVARLLAIAWTLFFAVVTVAQAFLKVSGHVETVVMVFTVTGTAFLLALDIFVVHWLYVLCCVCGCCVCECLDTAAAC